MARMFLSNLMTAMNRYRIALLLSISFLLWLFLYRVFIFRTVPLQADAEFYYDHAKFYVDALSRGVFPLWDPTWFGGFPNEFFLRRMGEFNPFLLLTLLLVKCGVPFGVAYLAFLVSYFFSGAVAFFFLARRVLDDDKTALIAFLLMLFSSLPLKLFDSYIFLILVPQIWFFAFFISFVHRPCPLFFVGIVFSLMMIVTTYLPFYFLTVFLLFLMGVSCLYAPAVWRFIRVSSTFVRSHKFLTLWMGLCFFLSCVPGVSFFMKSASGTVVMPVRQSASTIQNVLGVDVSSINVGGMNLPKIARELVWGLTAFNFDQTVVPLPGLLFFLFGAVVLYSRKLFVLLWMAVGLLLIGLTDLIGVTAFLYKHVFYFQYFRNFNHFLWVGLIPLFCLLCAGHLRSIDEMRQGSRRQQIIMTAFVVGLSAVFLSWLVFQGVGTTLNLVIIVACGAVVISSLWQKRRDGFVLMLLWFFLIVIGPTMSFTRLTGKAVVLFKGWQEESFRPYDKDYLAVQYTRADKDIETGESTFHVLSRDYKEFYATLPTDVFRDYMRKKFIIYDGVREVTTEDLRLEEFQQALIRQQNPAFVFVDKEEDRTFPSEKYAATLYEPVTSALKTLEIIHYDVNLVRLKTRFTSRRFLVYNDTYHDKWRLTIDGQENRIYRANKAFKGFWIPPGEHVIELKYGAWTDYAFKWGMLLLFYSMIEVISYFFLVEKQFFSDRLARETCP